MRLLKSLIAFVFVVAVLAAAAAVYGWFWLQNEVGKPGPLSERLEFTVVRGEGLASVAGRLEAEGLIEDRRILRLKAQIDGLESDIKAGAYMVPARASVSDILAQLVEGDVIQFRLTIPEGLTTAQILRRVEAAEMLTGEIPDREIAEGTLLPDTYVFGAETTRAAFIERMEKAQKDLLEELWPERQDGLPISTPEEAVILASVVEKETAHAEERGIVAGLFTARLKRGMRLESDPTIIYGVSKG